MSLIKNLKTYAKENNIPIMQDDGIEFLIEYIKKNNIKTILEIGSAIGYSSIRMALIDSNIKITTLEKNHNLYIEAVKNITEFNLINQIQIFNIDALEFETNDKYDLIFIDASKSNYQIFFERYQFNLNEKGVIISDNINFHNLLNAEIRNKRLRSLVRKINKFREFLENNQKFETIFINIGDGISISSKK